MQTDLVGDACRKCGAIFAKPPYWKAAFGSQCGACHNKKARKNTARYRASARGQAIEASYRRQNAEAIYLGARSRKEISILAVNKLKDAPCKDCGNTFKPHQMDFDHVRGSKSFNVGTGVHQSYPLVDILNEIKKCDLVCSNCHRDRTFKRAEQRRLARLN